MHALLLPGMNNRTGGQHVEDFHHYDFFLFAGSESMLEHDRRDRDRHENERYGKQDHDRRGN